MQTDFSANWAEPQYFSIGDYYRQRFGEKTYKIPVSIADDCPNRRGLNQMETCIFCDEYGSAANVDSFEKSLSEQIEEYKSHIGKKYNARQFLVYFQSYTNTFMGIKKLREFFDLALSYPFVKGIVIGTRPDCISKANIDMWNEYAEKTYVSVELGVQSFYDEPLEFLKRGHNGAKSIQAIRRIKNDCPKVDLGIHFIFGCPGESSQQIIRSAELCNELQVDNVKVHNLHVLRNTGLEKIYQEGGFKPIELEEFAEITILFLEHLSPEIPVHRLGAVASRWEELIAPDWTRRKMHIRQTILDMMKQSSTYQGRLYKAQPQLLALHNPRINLSL
tara:strand:+ start:28464 stop:29462 length:999 start_codon:yes stop_codon:yes gene_type:complete